MWAKSFDTLEYFVLEMIPYLLNTPTIACPYCECDCDVIVMPCERRQVQYTNDQATHPQLVTGTKTRGSYSCWTQYWCLMAVVLTTAARLQTIPVLSKDGEGTLQE
jgi:hypothetical protein